MTVHTAEGVMLDLTGPNLAYVLQQYETYRENPDGVSRDFKNLFSNWTPTPNFETTSPELTQESGLSSNMLASALEAQAWIRNLRDYGHLFALTNPLPETPCSSNSHTLHHLIDDPREDKFLKQLPAHLIWPNSPESGQSAADLILTLQTTYTGYLGFDFAHVHNHAERQWLREMVEGKELRAGLNPSEQQGLLKQLIEVDQFEQFLQHTFVGQKRFSIEGVDMLVPMLAHLISQSANLGITHVMMGMAHRGRLNTLAHILGKPYEAIFSEFHTSVNKDLIPSEGSMGITYGWSGDVKYHLGASGFAEAQSGKAQPIRLVLANNPSHLEFVDPVVEGFTRAAQDICSQPGSPAQDTNRALAILVHGDAAFPGEGIVAETLNLSGLPGYQTGGTIHIIANNQLGFTAEPTEGRTTHYASDLARGFEIPIVHVSADRPEACIQAVLLAMAYHQEFHKDFLIDLIGYRRWGHNEMDDPFPTQPELYQVIESHPRAKDIYGAELQAAQVVSTDWVRNAEEQTLQRLKEAYAKLKEGKWHSQALADAPDTNSETQQTSVTPKLLEAANDVLTTAGENFSVYRKLERVLDTRKKGFMKGKVGWSHAEGLAFATILAAGIPVRMTGQDSERGTFSQRHLVFHDTKTGIRYCPLQEFSQAKASFAIHNSPLSEAAIMGFEYGYSVQAPHQLVIWEAQFGDFANAAQVIIDQFLSAGLAKWRQPSGLVLLLPHGYEGQGPEHSSARLERFLQLSAEENWRVTYPTTAAQYFHLLRNQALQLGSIARPLFIMTPKSLLRNPLTESPIEDFTTGTFHPLLKDPKLSDTDASVQRLILTSGKIAVDLAAVLEQSEQNASNWFTIARLEQLYPLPAEEIRQLVESLPNLTEVLWLQEEPANMGAWTYIESKLRNLLPQDTELRYVGRPEHASPAEGDATVHQPMQAAMIRKVLSRTL